MRSKSAFAIAVFLFVSGIVLGQAPAQNPAQPPEPALKEATAPDIPGVIKGGTKVVLLRDGFNGTEGVIAMPDGSVLFTEQDANKILRVDKNDNISTHLENTNRTVGLAFDHKGRLIGTQSREPMIGVLAPTRQVLGGIRHGQQQQVHGAGLRPAVRPAEPPESIQPSPSNGV